MKTRKTNNLKIVIICIVLSLLVSRLFYQPLPDGFKQPWKYRFISFSSEIIHYFGRIMESYNLVKRVNLIRLGFHIGIGIFNIRDARDGIHIKDDSINDIMIRIYKPKNRTGLIPTIIFYHGGGYAIGSADILEPVSYRLAQSTNFQVIYIEYRLLPEISFPVYLEDSLSTTKILIENNKKYNLDLNNLILCGDSAGGNLATVISQTLIENKVAVPKLQVLIYPIMQFFDFTLPSYRTNLPKRILGNLDKENLIETIHYMSGQKVDESILLNGHTSTFQKESILSQYVNHEYLPDRYKLDNIQLKNDTSNKFSKLTKIILDKRFSPLLVSDDYLVKNTPVKTCLFTVEMDIVRDDGFIYAERLRRLNINVEHKHYENSFHGVWGLNFGLVEFYDSHMIMADVVNAIKSNIN